MPAVAKDSCGIRYCSAPQIKTGRAKDAMAMYSLLLDVFFRSSTICRLLAIV